MFIFRSKFFLAGMIIIIGWLGWSLIKIKLQDDIVNNEVGRLESKIEGLEESNSLLNRFLSYMTNPVFLEREARLKLNLKAPGEEVVFVYPDNKPESQSVEWNKQLANMPNYIKWWYWLGEK